MGGRALVITLVGFLILSGSVFYSITESSENLMKNVDSYYLKQTAQNIAQTGVNLAIGQLAKDGLWRRGFSLLPMMDGRVFVQLLDTTFNTRRVVRIRSIGVTDYGKPTQRNAVSTAYFSSGFVPGPLKAAITTNNPVSTLGGLVVDGRNHGMDGAPIAGSGTYGIWTTKTLSQSGSSTIGGTSGVLDYTPSKPGSPEVIRTGQTWPGGYPGSPDSVLGGPSYGFPEGTLKSIAMSGVGGSQYTTNPSTLTLPLRGVTYVELPSGGTWQSMDITGSGVLVTHNSAKNAAMKNINSGTFKGVIVADDVVHIHANIIGGLICLSPAPSEGNCIGNSSGSVLYSVEAILRAIGGAGTDFASGSASNSRVIAWWE